MLPQTNLLDAIFVIVHCESSCHALHLLHITRVISMLHKHSMRVIHDQDAD